MGSVVRLTSGAKATLLAEAARAAPREACGLLLGQGDRVDTATVTANVAADPARFFEIEPAALIAAHRAARAGGPQVLGYWHSHPNGRTEPSATDRAQATGDGRIWAIVAPIGAGWTLGCWRDTAHGFEALSTVIADG